MPEMKKQEVDLLTDEELCNACFKPLIEAYKESMVAQRSDSDTEIKEQLPVNILLTTRNFFH